MCSFGSSLTLVLCLLVNAVSSYSSGAGEDACTDLSLVPGHSAFTPTRSAPYTITVPYTTYSSGSEIPVTISGKFKGFLLIAVESDSGKLIGNFTKGSGALTSWIVDRCSGPNGATGLTHSSMFSSGTRTSINLIWNPPAGNSTVQFHATVVKTFAEYYVKIPGPTLEWSDQPPAPVPETTTPSSAVTLHGVTFSLLIVMAAQIVY